MRHLAKFIEAERLSSQAFELATYPWCFACRARLWDLLPRELVDRILSRLDVRSLEALRCVSRELSRAATAHITNVTLPAVRVAEANESILSNLHALKSIEMHMQINKIIDFADFTPGVLQYVTAIRSSIDRCFLSPRFCTQLHLIPNLNALHIVDDQGPTAYLRVLPQCTSVQAFEWSSKGKNFGPFLAPVPYPPLSQHLTSLRLLNCGGHWASILKQLPACTALRSLGSVLSTEATLETIRSCTGLTQLELSWASRPSMQSPQPGSLQGLAALPHLERLTLECQHGVVQPRGLPHLTRLRSLHLDLDACSPHLMAEIQSLTQLTNLDIGRIDNFHGSVQLTALTALRALAISSLTAFWECWPARGQVPEQLQALFIVSGAPSMSLLQTLTALHALQHFHVSSQHQDVLKHGIAFTDSMPELTCLEFSTGTLYDGVTGNVSGVAKLHPLHLEEDAEQRLYMFGDGMDEMRLPRRWSFWQRRIGSWAPFPSKHNGS